MFFEEELKQNSDYQRCLQSAKKQAIFVVLSFII